jgi:hypothetical protein
MTTACISYGLTHVHDAACCVSVWVHLLYCNHMNTHELYLAASVCVCVHMHICMHILIYLTDFYTSRENVMRNEQRERVCTCTRIYDYLQLYSSLFKNMYYCLG